MTNIVTVDASRLAPKPRTEYATLFNATPKEMVKFSKAHERCYVFNFWDKSIDELPNFRGLRRSKHADWLVQPFYLGNFAQEDRRAIIDMYVAPLSMDGAFDLVNITPGTH